ncbi:MAG: 2-oxoglutarate ferredoxin oxidoreductase, beta subunit [candidate division WS6 bacterium GW2011_GWE1_34_7]|uniref:2-oxoglutarate ferredoxin oxidoreductase, beta subunit n=1 Tax=candidate division WS6 bacterium GW2011_GWE1_34_7 TaxID=1619093 RepID=A0A0G0B9R4_9BACT|nr:MAG: 2-oxoglutarate ferredoxin oxidoreductase, beta subunit [candidate division WS6 bacterium GW2011_GWE1_34_7]
MKIDISDYNTIIKNTWCPGCGNFNIHIALKKALVDLKKHPSEVVFSFDIGCNGNGGDKIEGFRVKGLHGRAIPFAIGAHLANKEMTVIADIGDGGCLHEGIDHLIHAIRSNYNVTVLIHNNQNFALTTGQITSTTQSGKKMYAFPDGKTEGDINIGELVLALNPSFYAKGYSADAIQLTEIIKEGIKHKGFSVIEIVQICPTYNRENSSEVLSSRIRKVQSTNNIDIARKYVLDTKHIYTGVIYQNKEIKDYYSNLKNRKGKETELVEEVKNYGISNILNKIQ